MRDRPAGVGEAEIVAALAACWGIAAKELIYRPVGAGSYHWSAGDQWWVRLDGLGFRESFAELDGAFRTAHALRHLPFVVAPLPQKDDTFVHPLLSAYALSVWPRVDGVSGEFGEHPAGDRDEVGDILIALHEATPAVEGIARRTDLRLPGRVQLRGALRDLGREWTSGPYARAARALLAAHATLVERWLAEFDALAGRISPDFVVTHGEPHPGNFLRTAAGLRLIDWDTVLLAPPERDLWMVPDQAPRYGRPVDPAAMAFYRLWWKLADVAVYVDNLRRPHGASADAADALTRLTDYFDGGTR